MKNKTNYLNLLVDEGKVFYKYLKFKFIESYPINKLHDHLLIDDPKKSPKWYFYLNNLNNNKGKRQTDYIEQNPNIVFIDVDFHKEIDELNFKKEYKNYDNNLSLEENLEKFKFEFQQFTYITASSKSGKGVRFICLVLYDTPDGKLDKLPLKIRFRSNYDLVTNKLKEITGVITTDLSFRNNVTIGTNICLKKNSYVNLNPYCFNNTEIFNKDIIKKELNDKNKISIPIEEVDRLNKITYNNIIYDDIKNCKSLINDLKNRDTSENILVTLSRITDKKILNFFYQLFKDNYTGNSIPIDSFNNFLDYIDIKNRKWSYHIPLSDLLLKYGISLDIEQLYNLNDCDILRNDYTDKKEFVNYISEYQEYIDELIQNDVKKIIVKSPTGSGKTTSFLKSLNKVDGIKVFITPTNVIADQTIENATKLNINVKSFYNGKYDELTNDDNVILVTNLNNLKKLQREKKLKSLDIKINLFDECHSIISYSSFKNNQWEFGESSKTIFISATTEPFVIGISNHWYINFIKKDLNKKMMNIIPCKSFKSINYSFDKMMNKINNDKKVLVFINSRDKSVKIKEKYTKFNFQLINSKNKDKTYNDLMETEQLTSNVVVTSLINDGVNINNKKWDYVIILDNDTQNFLEMYQLVSRFRISNPQIYLLFRYSNSRGDIRNNIDLNINQKYKDIYYERNDLCIELNDTDDNLNRISKIDLDYIYKENNFYIVNKNKIKKSIYDDFTNNVRNNYFSFIYYLSFYFKIKIGKYQDEQDDEPQISKKDVFEFYKDNYEYITENINHLITITDNENNNFIVNNKSRLKTLINRHREMINKYQITDQNIIFEHINKPEIYYKENVNKITMINILTESSEKLRSPEKLVKYNIEEIKFIIDSIDDNEIPLDLVIEKYNNFSNNYFKSKFEIKKIIQNVLKYKIKRKQTRSNNTIEDNYLIIKI